ncbi:Phox homologous domain-containing protein, partial [Zychaea mexicana]|uniref:PX domain-containing protein n=1 Tax=Zychaea mexicana TaxID=64656 RepID=UPI0022FF45F5
IQAVFVPSSETRHQPKPHTVYCVEVHAAVRTWVVWKRYSDFVKLHHHFESVFPSHPVPVHLPTKRIFPSTFSDPNKIDTRRRGLEEYLRAILSHRDDRWRQTDIWKDFLAIPHPSASSSPSNHHATSYTSETWLDEYHSMTNAARQVRSLINKRGTHNARNEISASHNCTVQAKKLLVTLSTHTSDLDAALKGLSEGPDAMADGELRRRQDMLATLRDEKDALLKLVNSGRQEQELLKPRRSQTALMRQQPPRRSATIGPGRAFGAAAAAAQQKAKETEVTRGLDNDGLIQYQQEVMQEQDTQVEQFSALLARQKQLGFAIGDELETQNQILDELDGDVDRTALKLKFANKKL